MVAQVRYDKPIPAVGQWWAGKVWGRSAQYRVAGTSGEHYVMHEDGHDGGCQVTAEALAGPEWRCVGLTLPDGKRAMVGEMWGCSINRGGPFRLDAVVQSGRGVDFVVSHRGDDGRWTPPSYVGPAFMADHCSRVAVVDHGQPAPGSIAEAIRDSARAAERDGAPMHHVLCVGGASVALDAPVVFPVPAADMGGFVVRGRLDMRGFYDSERLLRDAMHDDVNVNGWVLRGIDTCTWPESQAGKVTLTFQPHPSQSRIKVNISVGGGATAISDEDARVAAAGIFAGALRKYANAAGLNPDAITAFTVPGSARVSMLGPVKATVRPDDVAAVLRRYADRMGQPFAGMSAASRKHLARVCGDTAHAIGALMEPRRGDVANCTARAEDAARAAQHGAAMIATLTVLDMTGATVDGERETDLVEQVSSQAVYACGLATARRGQ